MKSRFGIDDADKLAQAYDEFFKYNTSPWVFLIVRNKQQLMNSKPPSNIASGLSNYTADQFGNSDLEVEAIRKVLSLFNIKLKALGSEQVFFVKDTQLNHKEKALNLYFAGIFLTATVPTFAACLGQLNVLGERLRNHEMPSREVILSELTSEDFRQWSPASGTVYLGDATKLYIEQAGIPHVGSNMIGKECVQEILRLKFDESLQIQNGESSAVALKVG